MVSRHDVLNMLADNEDLVPEHFRSMPGQASLLHYQTHSLEFLRWRRQPPVRQVAQERRQQAVVALVGVRPQMWVRLLQLESYPTKQVDETVPFLLVHQNVVLLKDRTGCSSGSQYVGIRLLIDHRYDICHSKDSCRQVLINFFRLYAGRLIWGWGCLLRRQELIGRIRFGIGVASQRHASSFAQNDEPDALSDNQRSRSVVRNARTDMMMDV